MYAESSEFDHLQTRSMAESFKSIELRRDERAAKDKIGLVRLDKGEDNICLDIIETNRGLVEKSLGFQ